MKHRLTRNQFHRRTLRSRETRGPSCWRQGPLMMWFDDSHGGLLGTTYLHLIYGALGQGIAEMLFQTMYFKLCLKQFWASAWTFGATVIKVIKELQEATQGSVTAQRVLMQSATELRFQPDSVCSTCGSPEDFLHWWQRVQALGCHTQSSSEKTLGTSDSTVHSKRDCSWTDGVVNPTI